jgi:hypothetical protein
VVVRGETSPEVRLLFLAPSFFFRLKGRLDFVGGLLLCTSVENLSFFSVAGLDGSSDLVFSRSFGRIELDLLGGFGGPALFFGMKLKDGLGIAKGNCLGFFFGG